MFSEDGAYWVVDVDDHNDCCGGDLELTFDSGTVIWVHDLDPETANSWRLRPWRHEITGIRYPVPCNDRFFKRRQYVDATYTWYRERHESVTGRIWQAEGIVLRTGELVTDVYRELPGPYMVAPRWGIGVGPVQH